MQLSYSCLNCFVRKNQESTIDENDFEIPIVHLLHPVRTLNTVVRNWATYFCKQLV